jgi:hypothetical protein
MIDLVKWASAGGGTALGREGRAAAYTLHLNHQANRMMPLGDS